MAAPATGAMFTESNNLTIGVHRRGCIPFFNSVDMTHQFDVSVAEKYGVEVAIMAQHFQFWILRNRANKRHQYDGRTWTYNSARAFAELFPYWSAPQIRRILQKMIDTGIIVTGNYNPSGYDRTLWYAFFDESIWLNREIHLTKSENGSNEIVTPIPDILPDNKPDREPRVNKRASLAIFDDPDFKADLKEKFPSLNGSLEIEIEKCRDWLQSKGKRQKDYAAFARNWMRKAMEYKAAPNYHPHADNTGGAAVQIKSSIRLKP